MREVELHAMRRAVLMAADIFHHDLAATVIGAKTGIGQVDWLEGQV
jgi:hypothetical protein